MNRHIASILSIATTTAAIACTLAIASGTAYAESPTIDTTPFVSTRTRAEVQAELMSQRHLVTAAGGEFALQQNHVAKLDSGFTSAQAQAEYKAARDQVRAMNSEDSGSSYIARHATPMSTGITVARQAR